MSVRVHPEMAGAIWLFGFLFYHIDELRMDETDKILQRFGKAEHYDSFRCFWKNNLSSQIIDTNNRLSGRYARSFPSRQGEENRKKPEKKGHYKNG